MRYKRKLSLSDRMAKQTRLAGPDECWVWVGWIGYRGYGMITDNYKKKLVHRVAYELAIGPIPEGLQVCHHCDNKPCVNPAHLFVGTALDNALDKVAKGRQNPERGERHHAAKLTEEQAIAIRDSKERGIDLAARYGVHKTTISEIRTGRKWGHLQANLRGERKGYGGE